MSATSHFSRYFLKIQPRVEAQGVTYTHFKFLLASDAINKPASSREMEREIGKQSNGEYLKHMVDEGYMIKNGAELHRSAWLYELSDKGRELVALVINGRVGV